MYACLGVTPATWYLAEWPGSFTCNCGNTGVERTANKSQRRKLTLEKKILLPLQPRFEIATLRSRVWHWINSLLPSRFSSSRIRKLRQISRAGLYFGMHQGVPRRATTTTKSSVFSLPFTPPLIYAYFRSVQSLGRLDRRGDMRDNSAEIFQSFLREADILSILAWAVMLSILWRYPSSIVSIAVYTHTLMYINMAGFLNRLPCLTWSLFDWMAEKERNGRKLGLLVER